MPLTRRTFLELIGGGLAYAFNFSCSGDGGDGQLTAFSIEELEAGDLDTEGEFIIDRMYLPEAAEKAEMLEGSEEEVATKLTSILQDLGLL